MIIEKFSSYIMFKYIIFLFFSFSLLLLIGMRAMEELQKRQAKFSTVGGFNTYFLKIKELNLLKS